MDSRDYNDFFYLETLINRERGSLQQFLFLFFNRHFQSYVIEIKEMNLNGESKSKNQLK